MSRSRRIGCLGSGPDVKMSLTCPLPIVGCPTLCRSFNLEPDMTPLLSRVLRVSHPHSAAIKLASLRPDIYVPAHSFKARSVVTRNVEGLPGPGRLSFTVHCPYANPLAVGVWQYRVTVDGLVVALWDGAQPTGPVHIALPHVSDRSRVELQIHVRRDRLDMPSWERASRATIENLHFEVDDSDLHPITAWEAAESALAGVCRFTVPTCDIAALRSVQPDVFPWDEPTRFDVLTEQCTIPLLIVRRPAVSRTLILTNGAVDLERSQSAPVFQRSSWWKDLPAHQIYVCDPGTVGDNALPLAWCQINDRHWAVPDISTAVTKISALLGSPDSGSRLYFGSSAGGFVASALAILDDGSSALVNNAQFDWTRWMAGAVNALRSSRFHNRTPAEIRNEWPERTNIFNLAKTQNAHSMIDYFINMDSSHDTQVDLPIAENFLEQNPDSLTRLRIHKYSDPTAGHNPMGKEQAVLEIKSRLCTP